MTDSDVKQTPSMPKNRLGPNFGFRTPDFLKASRFGPKNSNLRMKYGPSSVRTQHKGGGGK